MPRLEQAENNYSEESAGPKLRTHIDNIRKKHIRHGNYAKKIIPLTGWHHLLQCQTRRQTKIAPEIKKTDRPTLQNIVTSDLYT